MSIHYEVESELNPRYLQTHADADYFGIYHVVKWDGDMRIGMVATYAAKYPPGFWRYEAYAHARRLNENVAATR